MKRTIVDVLQEQLGELGSVDLETLTAEDFERLADAVNIFYSGWSPSTPEQGEFRLYSGGWIAGNSVVPEARQYLYTSLLYAPSVVIHDPIADWFDPHRDRLEGLPAIRSKGNQLSVVSSEPDIRRNDGYYRHRSEPDRTRQLLLAALPAIAELDPLIRQEIVIPVPQWRIVQARQKSLLAGVRHDVRDNGFAQLVATTGSLPRSDQIRGLSVVPAGSVLTSDRLRSSVQDPSYFFHKTLAIADATGSRYVPPGGPDSTLLAYKLNQTAVNLRHREIELQVVSALSATDLPFLATADPSTIVSIRQDDDAFADWRAELRDIARRIWTLPSDGPAFGDEARDVLSDALLPKAKAIRDSVSRSDVMKAAARDEVLRFGVEAASLIGAGVITGGPLDVTALTALGLSSTAAWTINSIFRNTPEQPHGVLATLVREW